MKSASKTIAAIVSAVIGQGGKADDVGLIADCDELCQQVAKAVVEFSRKMFRFVVDYSLPLIDLIAKGKFDYANPNITEANFPKAKGKKRVVVELCHPNQYLKDGDEAMAWLRKNKPGYRDATLWELLVLAIAQPDLQRKFPIAALGSIWLHASGDRDFACLYGDGSRRSLGLYRLEFDFGDDWRFAVVREQS